MASIENGTINKERQICGICSLQFSKYTCPKCNIQYCSLECYKSQRHGNCSELFYKDCFMEELSQRKGSNEDKMKMMEILKRTNEQEESGNESDESNQEDVSLEQRLAGIDLDSDPDSVWDALTLKERQKFHDMFQSGTLAALVETTPTWWENIPMVTESKSTIHTTLPSIPSPIPSLSSMSSTLSPCIPCNIINVLYCYVYTVKIYNNSLTDVPVQSAQCLIELSGVLGDGINFTTVQDALEHAIAIVNSKPHLFNSTRYSDSLIKDVVCLVSRTSWTGNMFAVHALADAYNLLIVTKKTIKSSLHKFADSDDLLKQVFLVRKKIMFFISWCVERKEQLKSLLPLLRDLHH